MSAGVPEMRMDMNIMKEAIMLTMDSSASERSATEPDTKKAANFRQNTTNPPITAAVAD
jgi:hypothetical protein